MKKIVQFLPSFTRKSQRLINRNIVRPFSTLEEMEPRDEMEYDVAIVGGGPAGLSCAIKLKQLNPVNFYEDA
jgi:ribulose 1,5-bisphosphate synthetase/thiazole synthase